MTLVQISDEVDACIRRLRAIAMMADGINGIMPEEAEAFARVDSDAESAMIDVSNALAKLRKVSS